MHDQPGLTKLKFLEVEYKSINYPMNDCYCKAKKGATKIVHK